MLLFSMVLLVSCNGTGEGAKDMEQASALANAAVREQGSASSTGEGTAAAKAIIAFKEREHNLGRLNEGEKVIAWFDYTNVGNAGLIIQDIKAGCGCTVPEWKDRPLSPGDSAVVKVVFDSRGKHGIQNIPVTIISNSANGNEQLRIFAKVESIQ